MNLDSYPAMESVVVFVSMSSLLTGAMSRVELETESATKSGSLAQKDGADDLCNDLCQ